MWRSVGLWVLTLGGLMSGALGAQGPAQSPEGGPGFSDSTTVLVVEIPVNVIKDGAAVRGLTRDQFVVKDGRREREIVGFEVVDLKQIRADEELQGGQRRAVPISARRHFLFLLDLSFSQQENLQRAAQSARTLLETALHPTDLVAVGVYGKRTQAQMLLNFTPDRGQVESVLQTLEEVFSGKVPEDAGRNDTRRSDPLRLMAGPYASLVNDIGRAAGADTTLAGEWLEEGNLHPFIAETLADIDENVTNRRREARRSDVAGLSKSLSALAQQTQAIDGRKYMVYFSEGFASDLLFEEGGARTLRDLNKMIEEMQQAGWVLQTVNTARSGESLMDDADGLLMIAKETGGEFYTNFNRLDTAMEQMLDSTSVTYLLAVRADDVAMDGKFHPIDVRLVDGPRGARVRHRAGYFAPTAKLDEPQGLQEQLRLAELVLAGEDGGALPAAVETAVFNRGESSQAVAWIELDGPNLLLGHEGKQLELEIYGYALGDGNEIRDFFSQRIALDLSDHRDVLERGGLRFYGDFELPPGHHDLRFLVRRASDGRHGLRTASIEIAAGDSTGPRLLPPFFLADDADSPWLVVGESTSEDAAYPFVIGERRFVPAVRPVVSKSQPARICLMGYGLENPDLSFQVQLATADGFTVAVQDALSIVGRNDGVDGAPTQLFLNLDAGSIAPGEYALTAIVEDPVSGTETQSDVRFSVRD